MNTWLKLIAFKITLYTVFTPGGRDIIGVSRKSQITAIFDSIGNGMVMNEDGEIRYTIFSYLDNNCQKYKKCLKNEMIHHFFKSDHFQKVNLEKNCIGLWSTVIVIKKNIFYIFNIFPDGMDIFLL